MPPKRVQKVPSEKKPDKKAAKQNAKSDKSDTGTKRESANKDEQKTKSAQTESSKMTLCTKPSVETSRSLRRLGRPPTGKRMISRDMPGKLRPAYRRNLDPCDNSNDSGLGFDHQGDHQHTMLASERLQWSGERAESKRLRLDIKVEDEDTNDSYCFSQNVRQCKENISLIRTAPVSVPSLSIPGNTTTTTSRAVPRCNPIVSRQTPAVPISLTTQLLSTSRFSDIALTIVKQPEQQHRARYQTEGSRGAVKDRDGNGFPIVQLTGYYKPATLQVYIGTDIGKVAPHMFYQACKVSGKNSTPCFEKKIDGTCVIELALDPTKDMCATCDCVGILKERNVDVEHRFPDQLGNRNKKKSTRCRMIFRTTITHDNGTIETLQVCSQPIVCTQPPGIPEICKKSLTSCPASGGLELFVLGKNFLKDTKVYFQQFDEGRVCWEQAVVPDKEYLQQTHFVCVVPPYRRPNITEPVSVRLCVVSSGKTSESQPFVYTPVNGALSVHLEAQHSQPNQFFKGTLWNSRKHEQDLDMMPPPETSLVPISTRRSSANLPSTSDSHSPPLRSMKQEYIDENSQGSIPDGLEVHHERYRPISESSLDVNHDSNMSMINENSIELLHHNSLMNHMSDNSNLSVNEDSVDMLPSRNSVCENSVLNEENSCNSTLQPLVSDIMLTQSSVKPPPITTMEKVMDLRMKLPINNTVNDYVTHPSCVATLKRFGIEPTSAPLPTQSAQSVENYLTKIESKPSLLSVETVPTTCLATMKANSEKIDMLSCTSLASSLVPAPQSGAQSMFLNTQQPFLTETNVASSIAKSEAAAIAEQTMPGTTNTSNTNTTITSALGGAITTPINADKLNEIFNSTLESHTKIPTVPESNSVEPIITPQDVLLNAESSLLVPPVISTTMAGPILGPSPHNSPNLSPEVMLNSQIMCRNGSTVQQESLLASSTLPVVCQTNAVGEATLLPVPQQSLLTPVTTQHSAVILNSEPEKAVLLEAAVDFFKTQKKICELTTAPGIMTSTDTSVMAMQNTIGNNFVPSFSSVPSPLHSTPMPISKSMGDHLSLPVKDIGTTSEQNDKKIEDRMIPQSFTSLSENDLINLINPSCFDQV